jgi:signal transduction histidine kinase
VGWTRHIAHRWAHTRLRSKLFASYLAIVLIAVVAVFAIMSVLAPNFFLTAMSTMMPGGTMGGGMMGGQGSSGSSVSASLAAAFRQALMQALVLATLLATAGALALSYYVARQIARPVQQILAATQRIGGGQYAERVVVPAANANDELGQLATSLNEMAGALEQTERRRLELVGDVAHELRTPITTLSGYLEGLLDGVVDASPTTWGKLHTETLRLRRLVDDLQELSRAEAGQISLHVTRTAPDSIVRAAQERVAPLYADKQLELHVGTLAGAPDILADQDRAVQVLTNLLTNALRYTPTPGRVEVSVRKEDGMLAFQVRDTGIGIAADDLPRIFERFYRVEKSRARSLGGSGIGLTIAQALVEAMHGTVSAESAGLGQGSTFAFTLPIAG